MAAIMTYGFYKAGKGIREQKYLSSVSPAQKRYPLLLLTALCHLKNPLEELGCGKGKSDQRLSMAKELISKCFSELAREKMWSRIHLIPLLTAEEDRDLVRRHWADLAREKELLGSETKVYHGTRYALITSLQDITLGYIGYGSRIDRTELTV